jgi:small subunit ribosomal protein S16
MLAIRMQRTGRSGHAQFRVIVQDSRFSPTRGRVVAYLGSYDPHTKTATLDSEKAATYLGNGAQPSDRVARLLKAEGVKLPSWVKMDSPQKRAIKHPEKLRRNRPPAEAAPEAGPEPQEQPEKEAPAEETPVEQPATETTEAPAEAPAEEAPEVPESPAETTEPAEK